MYSIVKTNGEVIWITSADILDARGWVSDCEWADDVLVEILTDLEIIDGVNRHYSGGWKQFIQDA